MRRKITLATPILAAIMLLAVAVPALAAVNWQITMQHTAAFPKATGQAQYQAQPGQRELQIEAEHLAALAGKRVLFYANGSKFGGATVQRHPFQRRPIMTPRVPACRAVIRWNSIPTLIVV